MEDDTIYKIALTKINGIGPIQAKQLIERCGTATEIFKSSKKAISSLEGIGEIRGYAIKSFKDFTPIHEEIKYCNDQNIKILFLTDEDYPQRLLNCNDSPTLLYYQGNANLNNSRIISIVGTRLNSDYGKQLTNQIISDLANQNVLVVSGMAFGIDCIAHKAALQNNLSTIGVLAHGLDTLYPSQHKSLANDMVLQGGLLTEFPRYTNPDKHNFPRRNRIVAGIADGTIVIETAIKGGSMITAELSFSYNRDLFAVPGRVTDVKSAGCLQLIQQNKASIYTNTNKMMEVLGWQEKKVVAKKQRELFIELTDNEQTIVTILQEKETVNIDEIYLKSGCSASAVAVAILNLELHNVLVCLPGKLYRLL